MPIAEISSLSRSKGILCIVDGAQVAGAVKVNVKESGCHAYATNGHKWLMGPKGTDLLYLSKDVQHIIRPMQLKSSTLSSSMIKKSRLGRLPYRQGFGRHTTETMPL